MLATFFAASASTSTAPVVAEEITSPATDAAAPSTAPIAIEPAAAAAAPEPAIVAAPAAMPATSERTDKPSLGFFVVSAETSSTVAFWSEFSSSNPPSKSSKLSSSSEISEEFSPISKSFVNSSPPVKSSKVVSKTSSVEFWTGTTTSGQCSALYERSSKFSNSINSSLKSALFWSIFKSSFVSSREIFWSAIATISISAFSFSVSESDWVVFPLKFSIYAFKFEGAVSFSFSIK